jgi:hypothetical protein
MPHVRDPIKKSPLTCRIFLAIVIWHFAKFLDPRFDHDRLGFSQTKLRIRIFGFDCGVRACYPWGKFPWQVRDR